LICELAHVYEIGIPPPWWWDVDDATLATILELVGEQQAQTKKAMRKRGR
jgi:hypothetical protein